MKNAVSLFILLTISLFAQNGFARETILKMEELSLNQDLFNAKTRNALAEGQVKIAEAELKSQVALHKQIENIYNSAPNAVSLLEYKRSLTTLKVAELTVSETKAIVEATLADVKIYEKYLERANGDKVTATEVAKHYLALWTSRNTAAQFVVSKNEAELEEAVFERDMTANLVKKNAASMKELIEADREVAKAEESLQRAKDALLVTDAAMKKFDK